VNPDGATPAKKGAPVAPVVAGIVLLVGTLVFAFAWKDDAAAEGGGKGGHGGWGGGPPRGGAQTTTVSVEAAGSGDLEPVRTVPGAVEAAARWSLRAREAGTLTRASELGADVTRGQVIAAIDAGTLPAEIRRAEALVLAAKARKTRAEVSKGTAARALTRREALAKDRAVTAAELDDARATVAQADADLALADAEVARAEADVEVLRVRLEERVVRAPAAGKIAEVHRESGAFVARGDPVAELIAEGALEVRFTVTESDASVVRPGDPVTVRALGNAYTAVVRRIGAALDATSRALPVEAEVTGETTGLLPGMYIDVELKTELPDDIATVPVSALVGRGAEREVFRVVDGEGSATVKSVLVRVLADDGKRAAVTQLKVGEKIVRAGTQGLKDGSTVEVVE
jgi:membrane fusion protein (multidrug efflux system)